MAQDIHLIGRRFNWNTDAVDFRFVADGLEYTASLSYEAFIEHLGLRNGYALNATGQLECFDVNLDAALDAALVKVAAGYVGVDGAISLQAADFEPAMLRLAA